MMFAMNLTQLRVKNPDVKLMLVPVASSCMLQESIVHTYGIRTITIVVHSE